MSDNLLSKMLKENDWILADGGTGTELFRMGLTSGDAPELWNLEYPDKVKQLYKSFLDEGSDLILTNSFGSVVKIQQLSNSAPSVELHLLQIPPNQKVL